MRPSYQSCDFFFRWAQPRNGIQEIATSTEVGRLSSSVFVQAIYEVLGCSFPLFSSLVGLYHVSVHVL